ncbi:MAG: sulfotransferase [Deltaproteobacteria bacterium]|nr:sulfotransferase [Deltaproteobacteria bacterium]
MSGIVFLLYDSRSGSTLLSRLLDEYEDIGVTVESNFMISILRLHQEFERKSDAASIFQKLRGMDRFENLRIEEEKFLGCLENKEPTINSFVTCLLKTYFERKDPSADAWIVKDGSNGYFINQIIHEIPEAKFIHILRDGRAVLNSRMKTINPYGNKKAMARDPLTAARHWKSLVTHIDNFSKKFPERILEVRYEHLIKSTEEEIGRIRRFLGLQKNRSRKANPKTYFQKITEKEKKIHELVISAPRRSRCEAWKEELSVDHRKLFEYVAGDILIKKGYKLQQLVTLTDIIKESSLLKLYFQAHVKRGKDWISYLCDPKKLMHIIQWRLIRSHEPKDINDQLMKERRY